MQFHSFLLTFVLTVLLALPALGQVISFDELALAPESFFDGYGSGASEGSWSSDIGSFNTQTFGPGWSYSNVSDNTTPGFQNQWSAFPGADSSGNGNYALGNTLTPNGAFLNFDSTTELSSVKTSNSTYAALSMAQGDSFAKKFGGTTGDDPDFFRLTITGFSGADTTGSVTGQTEFFLADYRFADNSLDYIVDSWVDVDLSGFGATRSLGFALDGSDIGQFGLNTPAYFAIDNLAYRTVPEPTLTTFACLACWLLRRRRTERKS